MRMLVELNLSVSFQTGKELNPCSLGSPLFSVFQALSLISPTSFSDAQELGNEVPEMTMSHLLKSNPPPSLDGTPFDWSP